MVKFRELLRWIREKKELEKIKERAIAALGKDKELRERFEKFWNTVLNAEWEKYNVPREDVIQMLKRYVDAQDAQAIATGIRHMEFYDDPGATFGSFLLLAAMKSDKNARMLKTLIEGIEEKEFAREISKAMFVRARLYKMLIGANSIIERIERKYGHRDDIIAITSKLKGKTEWDERARARSDTQIDKLQAEGEKLEKILEKKALAGHKQIDLGTRRLIDDMVEEQGKGRLRELLSKWERSKKR